MGLGSEERSPIETLEVKRGKGKIFGGREGLPQKFLELSLNEQGNLRIKRLGGLNQVTVWGQDKQQEFSWVNLPLLQELPEKLYARIDGGGVIIDIAVPTPKDLGRLLRLNDAGRTPDSRLFRVEVNPPIRDLRERN
ncbi:MAG: hypothetical protein ACOYT7_03510 [Patescibacteria group bacterium]